MKLSGQIELTGNGDGRTSARSLMKQKIRANLPNLEAHTEGTVEINFEDDFLPCSESETTFAQSHLLLALCRPGF